MRAAVVARPQAAFVAALVVFYGLVLIATRFLHLPMFGDELHFWPTVQEMFQDGFPGIAKLQNYNELNTPLPFISFGVADRLTGAGIAAARAVNLLCSFLMLLTIAAAGGYSLRAALSIVGLLVFPYFLFTSIYMYTDVIAVLFAVGGVVFALAGRNWLAGICFVLGIASRQYIIAFPVALIASFCLEAIDTRKISAIGWRVLPYAIAVLTLAGWYAFFGDAAPKLALKEQSLHAGRIYPDHGLYFLATVGAFFVVIEAILFRSIRLKLEPLRLALAAAAIVGFIFFPPVVNVNTITDTMGYLDRAFRVVMSQDLRVITLCALAVLACLRFDPRSIAGLMVYANVVLMAAAHVGWDKYAMPLLAVLWLMQSMDVLEARRVGARPD